MSKLILAKRAKSQLGRISSADAAVSADVNRIAACGTIILNQKPIVTSSKDLADAIARQDAAKSIAKRDCQAQLPSSRHRTNARVVQYLIPLETRGRSSAV